MSGSSAGVAAEVRPVPGPTMAVVPTQAPAATELRIVTPDRPAPAGQMPEADKALVAEMYKELLTELELKLFIRVCEKTGLDPITQQIYPEKRGSYDSKKMVVVTKIEGYRLIAHRTGLYDGQDDALHGSECACPMSKTMKHPEYASVKVWRKGSGHATTGTRMFHECVAMTRTGDVAQAWKRMPYLMASKCAEAHALRKAFPNDYSGIYTNDEVGSGIDVEAVEPDGEVSGNGQSPQVVEQTSDVLVAEDAEAAALVAWIGRMGSASTEEALRVITDEIKTSGVSPKGRSALVEAFRRHRSRIGEAEIATSEADAKESQREAEATASVEEAVGASVPGEKKGGSNASRNEVPVS